MAKHRPVLTNEDITGVDVSGTRITVKQSQPVQLSLFQYFFDDAESKSNTIELYDAIPLYTPSRQVNRVREHGKYLPILEKEFRYRDDIYRLELRPARIRSKDGIEKEYYPTEREELIEQALRKIAARQKQGLYLNGMLGVQFYLKELKAELKAQNHDMNLASIVEGLKISNLCSKELFKNSGKKPTISSPIFPILMLSSREEWLESPETAKCYVQFHPLVTQSLDNLTFRQFNYVQNMGLNKMLGRWFHKRMSHNYRYASITKPYHINATSIIRDSGIKSSSFRKAVQTIDDMFQELEEEEVIMCTNRAPEYETTKRGQQKLIEVRYVLHPSLKFVDNSVTANQRQRTIEGKQKNT